MLAEGLAKLFGLILEGLGKLLTAMIPPAPGWVSQGMDALHTVLGYVYSMDSWVPVNFAFSVASAVVAGWVTSIGIQIARTVVSYFTLGGGSS